MRAPGRLHDQLAVSLGEAAAGLPGPVSHWFWLRYADNAGPHLRARFHGDPAVLGGVVLPALSAWCREAVRQQVCGGFSIEPYEQEIERYGGAGAITAAEHVFAADSQLALAILRAAAGPGDRVIAAALAAATTALAVAPGVPAEALGRPRLDRDARTRYDLTALTSSRGVATVQAGPAGDGRRPAGLARLAGLPGHLPECPQRRAAARAMRRGR